jgi:hypothetical protein
MERSAVAVPRQVSHHACRLTSLALLVAAAACNGPDLPARTAPTPMDAARLARVAEKDPVMGDLSGIAQHVAAAMQSPAVRTVIAAELKQAPNGITQLDLQDCGRNAAIKAMLDEGQRRGGAAPGTLCSAIAKADGMVLYMDRDLLARWDPAAVVPIVTALAHPGTALPAAFRGYRTPEETVDLPGDGSVTAPVLVVLPNIHPSRKSRRPELKGNAQPVTIAQPVKGAP